MVSVVCSADMGGPSGVRDQLSGCWTSVCRSCRNGSLTNLHRVTDGNRHNATNAAGLYVHLSSISNSRGESASFALATSILIGGKFVNLTTTISDFNEALSGN